MRRIGAADRMRGIERTLIRRMFDAAGPRTVDLGLGEPVFETPGEVAAAGIEAIRTGATRYTSTAGDPRLREAIAARTGHEAARIVVTAGSQEALFVSVLALVGPGDEVLVPDPGYPAYGTLVRMAGGRAVPYRVHRHRGYRIDPDDLARRLTPRTRLTVLCSPGNPTGAVHADADLARIAGLLTEHGIAWLSDEIYREIRFTGPVPSLADHDPDGGVVVSGFSKDLAMTGWRIGWARVPAPLTDAVIAVHQHVMTCAPSISQHAATVAAGPAGDRARAVHVETLSRRRDVMLQALGTVSGIEVDPPDGGLFCFVRVCGCEDSHGVAVGLLRDQDVLTIPGIAFGPGGEGCVRLSFAADEDTIREGVARFGRGIARG